MLGISPNLKVALNPDDLVGLFLRHDNTSVMTTLCLEFEPVAC
jgi:hypothetical protein